MILTFNRAAIQYLVDMTKAAEVCHVPYTGPSWGAPDDSTPGFNLVGDDGGDDA